MADFIYGLRPTTLPAKRPNRHTQSTRRIRQPLHPIIEAPPSAFPYFAHFAYLLPSHAHPMPIVDHYIALRGKPLKLQGAPSEQALLSAQTLEAENPVLALSAGEFLNLLALVVVSARMAHGRLNTKTTIDMGRGLDVLRGAAPPSHADYATSKPWDWTDIASLQLDPLVAFCYMRMVRDVTVLQVAQSWAMFASSCDGPMQDEAQAGER